MDDSEKWANAPIIFTIVPSPLGKLLLAATEGGVCRIGFVRNVATAKRLLRSEFPAAATSRDDVRLRPWVTKVLNYLGGQKPQLNLPLDVRGTAFQRCVWQALRSIPYGCTRSYSEIARSLGQPAATRAVAQACARNPVAVLIPCHRVTCKDGRLGGYRWAVERKRKLLAIERASPVH